jgi:hypothetical protein
LRQQNDHRSVWALLAPDPEPDTPLAWSLAAKVDSLAPPIVCAFQSRKAQLIVGGIIGKAGKVTGGQRALMDSANAVLVRARADREVDAEGELPGFEAIMRTQMGDLEQGLEYSSSTWPRTPINPSWSVATSTGGGAPCNASPAFSS